MTNENRPILYSFRRCPYAMRARMAVQYAGQTCELREVVLRNKPAEMIEASPKATVPVLIDTDGTIIDESFDIMQWAIQANDPDNWLEPPRGTQGDMLQLIAMIEGPFKTHLDRYKYAPRYKNENDGQDADVIHHRTAALEILQDFESRLAAQPFLFGERITLADIATAPFIRQFANTDRAWFDGQDMPNLQGWLSNFLESSLFKSIMEKYEPWESGTKGVEFGSRNAT